MSNDRRFEIDENQSKKYGFPYHYIPQTRNEVPRFAKVWKWSPSWLAAYALFQDFLRHIKISEYGHKHIDVGCGDGALINQTKTKNSVTFVGVDFDSRAINLALILESEDHCKREFFNGSLQECSANVRYGSGSLVEVIEHIPIDELEQFVKNFSSVLETNAHIFVTVPSTEKKLNSKHYQHFDFDSLRSLFSKDFKEISLFGFEKKTIVSKILRATIFGKWHYLEIKGLSSFYINHLATLHNQAHRCKRILLTGRKK